VTLVRWTPQAADDLQAIYNFIARDSPHYAQLTVEDILAAVIGWSDFLCWADKYLSARSADLRD
jgi:plasmid stabilization system protein ParE